MKIGPANHPEAKGGIGRSRQGVRGWTLVEMAGFLAVLGLLAGLSAPTFQDLSRHELSDSEMRQTLRLARGFRSEVCRRGKIPEESEAMRFMAAGVGLSESVLGINTAGQTRFLFRDPALRLLPSEVMDGPSVGWSEVRHVRFLLLSSVGDPLRTQDLGTTQFQALWDLQPGQVPEGWNGRAEDLVVGRIDLEPEFVEMGWDVIDAPVGFIQLEQGPAVVGTVGRFQCRLLKGTKVALLDSRGLPVIHEVVDTPVRYRLERGQWHRAGLWTSEPTRPSIEDFARMADAYLTLPPDRSVTPVVPVDVWNAFANCARVVVEQSRGGVHQGPSEAGGLAIGGLRDVLRGLVKTP